MPVYQNVKAIAHGGTLTLMGTDLEVGIRYDLPGIDGEGEAIWPVARLVAILRETAASEYEMPAEDASTFADVAECGDCTAELAAGDLQRMIRRTVFAAARDEGKYAMRGVLWDIGEKAAKLVATDGKRRLPKACAWFAARWRKARTSCRRRRWRCWNGFWRTGTRARPSRPA